MSRRSLPQKLCGGIALLVFAGAYHGAAADDLYRHNGWAALASDRVAQDVGDSLTVVVYENATATNSARSGSSKSNRLTGSVRAGSLVNDSGELALAGVYDGAGSTTRAGKMVAQISVVVDDVLPNGDLHVAGQQMLKIDGERTDIRIRGRVRRADIAGDNSVLSTRLADAAIDYDGKGFVTRSARPGVITRVFRFLGLS